MLSLNAPGRCCSRCSHPGTKSAHLKNGCELCGTEPGEACLEFTTEDKFRKSLRAKALALFPKFDPSQVVDAYTSPNDNLLPVQFGRQARPSMSDPDLGSLMKMKVIVKGRSQETSREFVKTAIGRLLSRAELLQTDAEGTHEKEQGEDGHRNPRGKPVPLEITKTTTVGGVPSYHISWRACATATDDAGNDIGGYEYSTVEPQTLVDKRFPDIVEKFLTAEKERTKQGDGEKNRRRAFLASLWVDVGAPTGQEGDKENAEPSPQKKRSKKRKGFFGDNNRSRPTGIPKKPRGQTGGDDVRKLLRCVQGKQPLPGDEDNSSIESSEKKSAASSKSERSREELLQSPQRERTEEEATVIDSPLFCHFGAYLIPITPIIARVPGEFPPRYIFIRHNHSPPH